MEFEKALTVDIDALDALDMDARVEAIDDAIHRLGFERRLTLLTDKQRQHMMDESMSDAVRQRIDSCKSDKEREEYITGLARATYFRRMAWAAYLNGETPHAPIPTDV
jgi:HD-like signal output (HDOD) protein